MSKKVEKGVVVMNLPFHMRCMRIRDMRRGAITLAEKVCSGIPGSESSESEGTKGCKLVGFNFGHWLFDLGTAINRPPLATHRPPLAIHRPPPKTFCNSRYFIIYRYYNNIIMNDMLRVLTSPAILACRRDHIGDSAGMNKCCKPYFFRVKLSCQRAFCFLKTLMQFILLPPQVSLVSWRFFAGRFYLKIIIREKHV